MQEQIRALQELAEMAAGYGHDITRPASNAHEAVQWLYYAYLGAVKEQVRSRQCLLPASSFAGRLACSLLRSALSAPSWMSQSRWAGDEDAFLLLESYVMARSHTPLKRNCLVCLEQQIPNAGSRLLAQTVRARAC